MMEMGIVHKIKNCMVLESAATLHFRARFYKEDNLKLLVMIFA